MADDLIAGIERARIASTIERLTRELAEALAAVSAERLNRQCADAETERQRERANEFRLRAEAAERKAAEARAAAIEEVRRVASTSLYTALRHLTEGKFRNAAMAAGMLDAEHSAVLIAVEEDLRALAAAPEQAAPLRAALAKAAERFREYERLHAAKPDPVKAKRNAEMAEMCERALAAAPEAAPTRDAMLILVAAAFKRDHDVMRCRYCKRAIHESRTGEPMHHQAECPIAGLEQIGFNPWRALAAAPEAEDTAP